MKFILYLCSRIEVDKFEQLATTIKNAKIACLSCCILSYRSHYNSIYILITQKDELFIYLRIGVGRAPR